MSIAGGLKSKLGSSTSGGPGNAIAAKVGAAGIWIVGASGSTTSRTGGAALGLVGRSSVGVAGRVMAGGAKRKSGMAMSSIAGMSMLGALGGASWGIEMLGADGKAPSTAFSAFATPSKFKSRASGGLSMVKFVFDSDVRALRKLSTRLAQVVA